MKFPRNILRTRIIIAVVAIVLVAAAIATRGRWHTLAAQTVASLRRDGAPAYFGAMAVLPALGFPLSALVLPAGPLFGPALGIWRVAGCAILALAVADILTYAMGALVLRGFAASLATRAGFQIPEIQKENVWKITFLIRLIPGFPFFFQGCLLGVARVSFGAYLAASLLAQSFFVLSVIFLGGGLVSGNRKAVIASALLFIAISFICHRLRKTWKRNEAPAGRP